jgi:hypothetical protein
MDDAISRYRAGEWTEAQLDAYAMKASIGFGTVGSTPFKLLFQHDSDVLNASYRFGKTPSGQYVYVWTNRQVPESQVPHDALKSPTANHGAVIGDRKSVQDEFENCVGSFRDWEGSPHAEEANAIVQGATKAFDDEENDTPALV